VINDDINIAAEFAADCSRDKAKRNMEDVLQRFPAGKLDGAYASCDEIAIGAALTIAEAGREDDFKAIVSVAGDPAGFEAVKGGNLDGHRGTRLSGPGSSGSEGCHRPSSRQGCAADY
jgi:ABC-type sugar transport system substrate-binding protein